jgi:hypothetical protein
VRAKRFAGSGTAKAGKALCSRRESDEVILQAWTAGVFGVIYRCSNFASTEDPHQSMCVFTGGRSFSSSFPIMLFLLQFIVY